MLQQLKSELQKLADPEQAKNLRMFFKTGPGQYGEGDIFLGIKVPVQRLVAKKHQDLGLNDVQDLLNSKIHEHRLIALLILIFQFEKGTEEKKKDIFEFYLKNTKNINNWDLVDVSVHKIVGAYLFKKDKVILYKLAKSKDLWERRIAMIACAYFIGHNEFEDALKIAELLLDDKHDLIHKAVGWMLREIGKRNQSVEEKFLKKYYKTMPRTMLRYAIEKFDETKRKDYLKRSASS